MGTLSQQGFAADFIPASAVAKFAPLEHYYPDSKTAPMADAVSGVPAISLKAEPSSEIIARQEQISSEAAQSGNNRSQSSVQRAISRQNSVLSQNHYAPRDNNVFKGEPARFVGNELWTGHTAHFASPLVTVNRKFSLSSGNRFEGLGSRAKNRWTIPWERFPNKDLLRILSLQAQLRNLPHWNITILIAKRPQWLMLFPDVPAISLKAEPSSEIIARQEQISSEAPQAGNNRSQSSVQRAISRQNRVLSQNHYTPRDNSVFQGEPARFVGNELWTGHTAHFASPLVTVNRKFSLSSGNRFEGLGLARKIGGHTVGTLSQQGFAADFIPASAVAKFAPLESYHPDSKTAPMADAVSGVPAISLKAEPSSGIIARQEQISFEAAQAGNNRSQSSVQQAVERQNSIPVR